MSDLQVTQTPLETAKCLIDEALAECAGTNLIETSKFMDLLLDIRLVLAEVEAI